MALVVMCCFDTVENLRTEYTKQSVQSLLDTVDFNKNRVILVNNASCKETKDFLDITESKYSPDIKVIHSNINLGTAGGVNLGLKERRGKELVVKMDNDVVIHRVGWLEEMKEVFKKLPRTGILGLKRNDLGQSPNAEGFYKTTLEFLPHTPEDRWVVVEKSQDIIGTCTMINPNLLDKIGYFRQIGVYGFDDAIISKLSLLQGFTNYFLPSIPLDHIDVGGTNYIEEKRELANKSWDAFGKLMEGYISGKTPVYFDGGFK